MKNRLCSFLLVGLLALATALPVFSQTRTPIVVTKNPLASVAVTDNDATLWASAQPALNFTTALVSVRKSGTVSGCTLTWYTGQTAATATAAVNDANATFSCASATNKVITNIDNYLQGAVSSWTGSGTITIYVTLTNGAGWSLNATLSNVTQGDGAASPGAVPWYVQGTDGTNLTPAADVAARRRYVQVTNGTQSLPTGDALARSIFVVPGNATTSFLDVKGGVGAQGAGVQQVQSLHTLSAAVSDTTLVVAVAAPGAGSVYLAGLLLEKVKATTGSVTVTYGTGAACVTGPTTVLGPILVPPAGYIPLGILITAQKALCLSTDSTDTVVRALTQ